MRVTENWRVQQRTATRDFSQPREPSRIVEARLFKCLCRTAESWLESGDRYGNAVGAAAAYRRIFLAAVRDRPLAYADKFVRQMAYGASVAWPPYGLDPAIPVSTDDVPHVSDIMTQHGRATQPIGLLGGSVRIGLLSDLPGISAYLFRALSTAFVIAVIFWTVTAVRRWRPGFSTRAAIVIVMWAASIATAAGARTLDVWRYLIPAVPMVGLMLPLFAVALAETIVADHAAPSATIRRAMPSGPSNGSSVS